jgi:choline dehydrogenase
MHKPQQPHLNPKQVGFGRFKVAQKGGRRVTSAGGYLPRAVRKRTNLDLATESFVTKVLLEGDRAVGVQFVGKDGQERTARIAQGGEVGGVGG